MFKPAGLVAVCMLLLVAGCGPATFFTRAQEICNKYPTPDARAECERREKQVQAAFQQQQALEASKQQGTHTDDTKPTGDLCFVRKVTGERVCPN